MALHVAHDGRPWSRKRVMERLIDAIAADGYPFRIVGDAWIERDPDRERRSDRVFVRVQCDWFVDGRCAHYEDRPDVCRRYPEKAIEWEDAAYCPLLERLRRQKAQAA